MREKPEDFEIVSNTPSCASVEHLTRILLPLFSLYWLPTDHLLSRLMIEHSANVLNSLSTDNRTMSEIKCSKKTLHETRNTANSWANRRLIHHRRKENTSGTKTPPLHRVQLEY